MICKGYLMYYHYLSSCGCGNTSNPFKFGWPYLKHFQLPSCLFQTCECVNLDSKLIFVLLVMTLVSIHNKMYFLSAIQRPWVYVDIVAYSRVFWDFIIFDDPFLFLPPTSSISMNETRTSSSIVFLRLCRQFAIKCNKFWSACRTDVCA